MGAILKLWMDVILLLTLQYDVGRKPFRGDGSAERFNRSPDEASRYSGRSGRSTLDMKAKMLPTYARNRARCSGAGTKQLLRRPAIR